MIGIIKNKSSSMIKYKGGITQWAFINIIKDYLIWKSLLGCLANLNILNIT
ncbi:hypothetical protein STAPHY8AQ_20255 [Staphylococcus sp. 8AQ]|nr:hypothetical protein STAPHY8AQ_20255 [Staphylococcus sp. 8AQ]